jgi:Mce-associated membrane protein
MTNTADETAGASPAVPAKEVTRRSLTVPLPSGTGLARGIGALLVLLLVATVVVAAVRLGRASPGRSLSGFQRGALSAATTYAAEFATYDYKDFNAQVALTESHSVDPFLSQYQAKTAQLRSAIIRAKSVSRAKVISAGIASISSTAAVVDVFLDQTISNSESTAPRVESQRVQITMVRRGDRWWLSKVLLP